MTLHECTEAMAQLGFDLGVELEREAFQSYHLSLGDVPAPLFREACKRASMTPREKFEPRFPPPAKLRQLAEQARQRAILGQLWQPCAQCEDTPRWIEITDAEGHKRVKQCPCVAAYRERVRQAGLAERLALPAAEGVEAS